MKCNFCKTEKSDGDFYVSSRKECKECVKQRVRKNRLDNIDYYRSYDRLRASNPSRVKARKIYANPEMGKKARKRAIDNWSNKRPERRKASYIVSNALRNGKLKKQVCYVCGESKVEAHHYAYDMPLDVTWLCVKHHKQLHKEFKEAA